VATLNWGPIAGKFIRLLPMNNLRKPRTIRQKARYIVLQNPCSPSKSPSSRLPNGPWKATFRRNGRARVRLRAFLCRYWTVYFQSISCLNQLLLALLPDGLDLLSIPFEDTLNLWSEGLTADVQPTMCHSHSDYFHHEAFPTVQIEPDVLASKT